MIAFTDEYIEAKSKDPKTSVGTGTAELVLKSAGSSLPKNLISRRLVSYFINTPHVYDLA